METVLSELPNEYLQNFFNEATASSSEPDTEEEPTVLDGKFRIVSPKKFIVS